MATNSKYLTVVSLMIIIILQIVWILYACIMMDGTPVNGNEAVGEVPLFDFDMIIKAIRRMWMVVVATIFACVLLVVALLEQLNEIDKQRQVAQLKDDFSYSMVHDMKTPLSSIMMASHLLGTGKLDEKPKLRSDYFRILNEETQHLMRLVNRLLTISKLENGRLTLCRSEIDLQELCDKLVAKWKLSCSKPFRCEMDLKAPMVFADREYLEEAIDNLLDNAVKYSKEKVCAVISSQQDGKNILLSVYDEGIGISKEEQAYVFDKFHRSLSGTSERRSGVSGFGLGLNFVALVMKAHKGNVKVQSRLGEWTRFTMRFPLSSGNGE